MKTTIGTTTTIEDGRVGQWYYCTAPSAENPGEPGPKAEPPPWVPSLNREAAMSYRSRKGMPLVVVANEPLAYRDVICAVLGELRPHLEVVTVEPEDLDQESWWLASPSVVLVVCSQITPLVQSRISAWVELYPGHASESVVSLGGKKTVYPNIDFNVLLWVLDEAERLCKTA